MDVGIAVRLFLGLLFVFAGVSKAANRGAFQDAVQRFAVVPMSAVPAVAAAIPAAEASAGCLLLLGTFESVGALLIAALALAFSTALAINLRRGTTELDCRCFGRRTHAITWTQVALNLGLLVLASLVLVSSDPPWSLSDQVPDGLVVLGSLNGLATVLAATYAVVVFQIVEELASLRASLLRYRPPAANPTEL